MQVGLTHPRTLNKITQDTCTFEITLLRKSSSKWQLYQPTAPGERKTRVTFLMRGLIVHGSFRDLPSPGPARTLTSEGRTLSSGKPLNISATVNPSLTAAGLPSNGAGGLLQPRSQMGAGRACGLESQSGAARVFLQLVKNKMNNVYEAQTGASWVLGDLPFSPELPNTVSYHQSYKGEA